VQVVVHCWGGSGRTGVVLAAWLVRQQGGGLSPEQAAAEVGEAATAVGTQRQVDLEQLIKALELAAAV
jgi:protein-tyrosine phosphatase